LDKAGPIAWLSASDLPWCEKGFGTILTTEADAHQHTTTRRESSKNIKLEEETRENREKRPSGHARRKVVQTCRRKKEKSGCVKGFKGVAGKTGKRSRHTKGKDAS